MREKDRSLNKRRCTAAGSKKASKKKKSKKFAENYSFFFLFLQVKVSLFQGERLFVRDNYLIGSCTLENITRMPKSFPQIEITVNVDWTGWITMIVRETISDVSNFCMLRSTTPPPPFFFKVSSLFFFFFFAVRSPFGGPGHWGGLESKQIKEMHKQAELQHDIDKAKKARVEALMLASVGIRNATRELNSIGKLLSEEELNQISQKIEDLKNSSNSKSATPDQILQAVGELDEASKDPFAKAVAKLRKKGTLTA